MVSSVEEIEKAISQLPKNQLQQFRVWYQKFDSTSWDVQIEKVICDGNLDALASRVTQPAKL